MANSESIRISTEVKKYLDENKIHWRQSYDDVIREMIKNKENGTTGTAD